MKYTCPKCGKRIELSIEALIAAEYKTVCPQCLSQLEIVGDYAYIPLDDGSLNLRREDDTADSMPPPPTDTIEVLHSDERQPAPPPVPAPQPDGRDPLFDEAVRYLSQCSAITPIMLRDYFSITLERAQALIAQLEQAGYIGPYRGGAPRQILIDHQQGLPNPMQYGQRYNPNVAPTGQEPDDEHGNRKIVSINCSSCLLWLLMLAFVAFLLFK